MAGHGPAGRRPIISHVAPEDIFSCHPQARLIFAPMLLPPGKKLYFLSDFHLGAPDHASSLVREKRIVGFLERTRADAEEIFIVGDLFDFWYEYRTVVPKGYTRILGKMAEIVDS